MAVTGSDTSEGFWRRPQPTGRQAEHGAVLIIHRLLPATVLLGAALRFATLGTQSLWGDEGFTAKIATHSLASAVSQVPKTESTPPLYYALAWMWAHVFGSSAYALRSLSALFGTAAVAGVYWAARALSTRRVALLGAVLTAISPIMVWYSQEARAYSLMVLLTVLALGFCLRAAEEPRRTWLVGWGGCSALALATHYFAVFPLVVEATWLLMRTRPRRDLLYALTMPVIVGAALVPLLLYQKAHVPRPWTSAFTVTDQLKAVAQSFLVGITWTSLIHRLGVVVLAAAAVAALIALVRGGSAQERRAGVVLGGLAAVSLGIPVVISVLGTNYLAPRNVLYAWPMLALLVALGAARRTAGPATAVLLAAGCAVSLAIVIAVPLTPRLQRDDWRDLLAPLRSAPSRSAAPGSAPAARGLVVVEGFQDAPVIEYYLPSARPASAATRVSELDVLGTRDQLPAAAPLPGLTGSGVTVRGNLALTRFVAARGAVLPRVLAPGVAVLVQR